jgi:flagellar basal body-associated protein FliL
MAKNETAAPAAAPKSGPGIMGKIVGALIIGVIVLVQAGLVYFLLPNPDVIANRVRDEVKKDLDQNKDATPDVAVKTEEGDQSEVELGTFALAIHQPSSNTTLNLTCRVMGTIDKAEQPEYDKLLENNKNRLRERIIIEFRSAELDELTDPGLGLLKRRILEKSNQLLGKPLLKSIMFPEYNYYQQ